MQNSKGKHNKSLINMYLKKKKKQTSNQTNFLLPYKL